MKNVRISEAVNKAATVVSTCGGIGYIPLAPGTIAAAAAVIFYGLVLHSMGSLEQIGIIVLAAVISAWLAQRISKPGVHDPNHIVSDEIVGTWVALFMVPASWEYLIGGFVLFRLFDIIKPFPIKRLERLPGGIGIVADDVLAGVYAAAILHIVRHLVVG